MVCSFFQITEYYEMERTQIDNQVHLFQLMAYAGIEHTPLVLLAPGSNQLS